MNSPVRRPRAPTADSTSKGGNKPNEPGGGSDGIPDKYRVKVTFQVKNGLWSDGTDADKSVWLTKFAADGKTYAVDGTATLDGAQFPATTPALPFDGYKADGAWTNGNTSVTATTQSITEDTVYVFTYAPKGEMTGLHGHL